MRSDEVVRPFDFVLLVVLRVESVCCAFTVDTPPRVRAIARPIAQLLENPIRIGLLSSHCGALRLRPRGRPQRAEHPEQHIPVALRATTIVAGRQTSGILRAVAPWT